MKESGLSSDFIQELKSKNDIVSIISKYVHLEKKGRNFWGCCPFHHEKTPSFCINEYEQFYHCFGCGESGDVITFLKKYENMEYKEVIEYLAKNVGMEIPKFTNDEKYLKNKKIKNTSLEILNLTKEFYKQNLYTEKAKPAQEYIKKRKVTRKELEDFELGYSPDYDSLVHFLREKKFTVQQMKQAGVCEISSKYKNPYDFLAERLIFPIINVNNDCIGFSGRDLKNSGMMKYKNTSATLVFDKSKTIYAINLIKKLKQSSGLKNLIIVEGQFDVITMHRYGFNNTVACMGTAITKEHIRDLKRFTDNIILCLDGDSAGRKATIRAINNLENSDLNIKVAPLPNNFDPDEYLEKYGVESLQKLIDEAITPMSFKILLAREKYDLKKLDEKTNFLKEVLAEISKISSSAEKMIYLDEIKKLTGISTQILARDLTDNTQEILVAKENIFQPEQDATAKAIKFVLASYLYDKNFVDFNFDLLPYLHNKDYVDFYNFIMEYKKNNKKLIISTLFDNFEIENNSNLNDIINFNFEIVTNNEKYFKECLWLVIETELKFRKFKLSKQYNTELPQRKKEIIMEINDIDKILKSKNIGEMK